MKHIFFLFLLIAAFTLVSCQKESSSEILKTETILKALVEENNVKTCHVLTERHKALVPEYENAEFRIDQGFLMVTTKVKDKPSEHSYSLLYLSRYKVNEENVLVLHFALEKKEQTQ
jgi:hypothetical protein